MMNIFLVFIAQLIYSTSDVLQRMVGLRYGYGWHLVSNYRFWGALSIAAFALLVQMYVLSRFEVGKTIIFLGIFAVVITPIMGLVFLGERLSLTNWTGVALAIGAMFLVAQKV